MLRVARIASLVGVFLGLWSGCGSDNVTPTPSEAADNFQKNLLVEVGELFRFHKNDVGRPPKSVAEFMRYEAGLPMGLQGIKDGDIIVLWGEAMLDENSDKVLAYDKSAPISGGLVLLQDGKTIKKMTVEEFKSAKRVAGKVATAKP